MDYFVLVARDERSGRNEQNRVNMWIMMSREGASNEVTRLCAGDVCENVYGLD